MKKIKSYCLGLVLAAVTLLITSCGGGGSSTPTAAPNPNVAVTTNYKVEYVPGAPANPTMGKTTFQLKVTNLSDGTPATEKTVALAPMMHMTTMNHSTPVDVVTESSTPGTYDCTIYYIMASDSVNHWVLDVIVDGETATFSPTVGGMITIPKLKGQSPDDLITTKMGGMTTTEPRTYFLLKDGPTTTTSISLFIAAQGNMKMTFSGLYSGVTLTKSDDSPWTVGTVTVESATDPAGTWQSGTNTSGGHWTVPIATLSSGQTGTVYVRLTVGSAQKSTDGLATGLTNTNGHQTLVVTEGI